MTRFELPDNLRVQGGALIASALRDLVAFHEEVIIEMEEMRSGFAGEERNMVDADLAGLRSERDRLHARLESWEPFTARRAGEAALAESAPHPSTPRTSPVPVIGGDQEYELMLHAGLEWRCALLH